MIATPGLANEVPQVRAGSGLTGCLDRLKLSTAVREDRQHQKSALAASIAWRSLALRNS